MDTGLGARILMIIIYGLAWVMVLTSILGDVSYPWEGLVSALLNDLQVTHLLINVYNKKKTILVQIKVLRNQLRQNIISAA